MKKFKKLKISQKLKKIVKNTQVSPGLFSNPCHIEVNSNEEAIIEGCKGVLDYDKNLIRVDAGKMRLLFAGKELLLKCLTSDSLIIHGKILSVEFQDLKSS
ncbi:MAG: YabP/YqfC family sporulation protein [Oscillospiraceae bacterium]|nr:YabP/YqfC family sporulation protein [Oscillospiraceae bacterium]